MLTREEIAAFHRTGFLMLRGVFVGRELYELRAAAGRVVEEGVAERGHDHWSRDIDGRNVYFRSERLWQRDDVFQSAVVNPTLLECIGQLFGHAFLPLNDSMVCKLPYGKVPVEWHQDPPYQGADGYPVTFGVPNFDVDIYLDESTVENGCVWIIPEHHLVGKVDIERYTELALYREHGALPLLAQPGDVGLHALSAPHGSEGNASAKIRRVVFFHYVAREVYDACYSGWMNHNGGYSPAGVAFVGGMVKKREALGYDGIDGRNVTWTENGFRFVGEPATPPHHWATEIARMSPLEAARKRRLEWVLSERA
jgi:ectoine hydroxylase-related dioxygenase (phytanoyl-CoA dioxygenase family)